MQAALARIWKLLFVRKFKQFEVDYGTGKISNKIVADDYAAKMLQIENNKYIFVAMQLISAL